MVQRTTKPRFRVMLESRQAELERWQKIIHDLPDVRVEKVLATRNRLRNHEYAEDDKILDTTARLLASELEDPVLTGHPDPHRQI